MNVTPESVQQRLTSEDYGERLSSINQLRELDPAIAFELIKLVVNDANPRVRYAAISQVSSLGRQNPDQALEILRDRLLNDSEADVQAAAADSIGALKLKEAYTDLESLYHTTSEWLLQFSIIAALGELSDPRAFDLLAHALDSDNDLVRTAAIGSLGELGDERAIPLLLPYVSNPDWQIRHRVVRALSHFHDPEATHALESLAEDEMDVVAQEAKQSLQR
jgi:HEAT repeat protein